MGEVLDTKRCCKVFKCLSRQSIGFWYVSNVGHNEEGTKGEVLDTKPCCKVFKFLSRQPIAFWSLSNVGHTEEGTNGGRVIYETLLQGF